jgi:hypothetical protein
MQSILLHHDVTMVAHSWYVFGNAPTEQHQLNSWACNVPITHDDNGDDEQGEHCLMQYCASPASASTSQVCMCRHQNLSFEVCIAACMPPVITSSATECNYRPQWLSEKTFLQSQQLPISAKVRGAKYGRNCLQSAVAAKNR